MATWWNPLSRSKRAGRKKKAAAKPRRRKVSPRAKPAKKAARAGAKRKAGGRTGTRKIAVKKAAAKKGALRKSAARSAKPVAKARKKGPVRSAKAPAGREAAATERIQLRWIAQARSGDKGDVANIALFAPTEEMYKVFCREVTAQRVKAHFGEFVKGRVDRFEVPNVRALNFVAYAALGGGGASSLRSDPLGKSYGSNLLRMEITVPAGVLARTPKWQPPKTLPQV